MEEEVPPPPVGGSCSADGGVARSSQAAMEDVSGQAGEAAGSGGGAAAHDQAHAGTAAKAADEAADDDDDPVVQECDVYLNRMYDPPDFVGHMYVLQYPLRPDYRPYGDQGELEQVELKTNAGRLRFTYRLKQDHNYSDDGVVGDKITQKHVLNSTVVSNPACSYAVGVIHKGRMTLTPIRAMNQLRPNFDEFDRGASRHGGGAGGNGSGGGGGGG
eukprot:CAMPEP_0179282852 /NCGR_PEP_ID=MMETSP0797-20121207/37874_1 /TAXON_ID=47934 /ORGANISM="Dinophysis acuminata, Strain DAEP01" /LENGTH=215 /DNA_ID=CAMNT_0020991587 /DNA_START=155 /DNA_END=799 /DNA_ORIENTATION=-